MNAVISCKHFFSTSDRSLAALSLSINQRAHPIELRCREEWKIALTGRQNPSLTKCRTRSFKSDGQHGQLPVGNFFEFVICSCGSLLRAAVFTSCLEDAVHIYDICWRILTLALRVVILRGVSNVSRKDLWTPCQFNTGTCA